MIRRHAAALPIALLAATGAAAQDDGKQAGSGAGSGAEQPADPNWAKVRPPGLPDMFKPSLPGIYTPGSARPPGADLPSNNLPRLNAIEPISPEEAGRRMSRWITRDDYPVAAIKARAQGSTTITWTIGVLGFITDCHVVVSSGNADLDAASCENLTRRARYHPAIDRFGNPVPTQRTKTIKWVLPE
ncbi:MAG: energy transducer TonB [Sphingobium sp.]